MTEKLYYQEPYLQQFQALVTEVCPGPDGTWNVILDRTAFYPEGGGQPYDTGWLNGVPVLAVHEKSGMVIHTIEAEIAAGSTVDGILDWERRFRHMQLHSGEHLLSGLIYRQYGYDNVGFHMGKEEVTIDFNGILSEAELWALEVKANHLLCDNRPINTCWPDEAALEQLDYRSKKQLTGAVRIVEIPGGDCCACCGTHVRTTSEIGIIKAVGMIHYKGGVRISIQCGLAALDDYGRRLKQTAGISRLLSAKQNELIEAVEKLKQEAEQRAMTVNHLYQQLIELKAAAYPQSQEPLLVMAELPAGPMRQLCTMLYEQQKGSVVMVCSGADGNYQYVAGSSSFDLRTLSRSWNQQLNGKGGGTAQMVQGTFYTTEEQIKEVLQLIVQNS